MSEIEQANGIETPAGMTVRELIEQLERFDPTERVEVSGADAQRYVIRDVGRADRDGSVFPVIYAGRSPDAL